LSPRKGKKNIGYEIDLNILYRWKLVMDTWDDKLYS